MCAFRPGGPSSSGIKISTDGGSGPLWSRDGKELFYKGADDRMMAVSYTVRGESFEVDSKPHRWSNTQLLAEYDLAPDGKRFVIQDSPQAASTGEPKVSVHVTFLLNFFDEARRRIPLGK